MVRVKICGITNFADARAAIDAGADMLGFNFYRPSPRFIEPKDARAIIQTVRTEIDASSRTVKMIGVFVNESSAESLASIAGEAGVDGVQLHGDESFEFCGKLKAILKDRVLIKMLSVSDDFDPARAAEYEVDAIMLDAFHSELRGGTGRVIDWSTARRTRDLVPHLYLAGGLSPENVAEAIAEVRPYAVDACSALESSPGTKNAERMKAFVRAVRSA
ncbi:MAG TPA: phosphoribosylanthranilate isomerase [Pyrinomonadaceae bacterium]|nr:phosphoribosylanthranilate isomerase [Pyrinomonadaceae bacterium]